MKCPRCNQEVETGATYCGNCGQALGVPAASAQAAVPAYALSPPVVHEGETKALLSLILGIVGLMASFIPLLGVVLGIAGLVLGSMTRHSHRRMWSTLGIILSALAVAAALAFWSAALVKYEKSSDKNHAAGVNTAAVTTATVRTPCYNLGFPTQLNTDYDKNNSCDMRAYEGSTILVSNDVYKVYANQADGVTQANFYDVAKTALEKDVSSTLPSFTIDSERTGEFAGSPAYIVNASDHQNQIAVVEAAVLHKVSAGYNLFSLVHATKGTATNLNNLESQWQWK